MKLLLDSCVWAGCIDELTIAGHDVVWVGRWERDPGDAEILEYAREQHRVLVTLDKDFGELVIVRGIAHSGIVRIVGGSVRTFATRVASALDRYSDELDRGAIITDELYRIRVRDPKPEP